MKLRWTRRARTDLSEIHRYIARDNPAAAHRWIDRLRSEARRASAFPHAGRIVPEFARDDVREIIVRNYRIVYRVTHRTIDVLTVFEGHRLLPSASERGEHAPGGHAPSSS